MMMIEMATGLVTNSTHYLMILLSSETATMMESAITLTNFLMTLPKQRIVTRTELATMQMQTEMATTMLMTLTNFRTTPTSGKIVTLMA